MKGGLKGIRRALVIGAKRSGRAVVVALIEEGIEVTVIDSNATQELKDTAVELEALGARVQLGVETPPNLGAFDLVVPSPAVKPSSKVLTSALARRLPILSEVELAYRLTDLDIVGITGTNGKTTTTSLVGHVLQAAGRPSLICGNIGYPLVAAAREAEEGCLLVAELSSFQLEYTTSFRPKVAALLNLTQDHLDWHGDLGRYVDAKLKIFANQTPEDFAVVNWDDPLVRQAIPRLVARVVPVSHHVELEGGVYIAGGEIRTDFSGSEQVVVRVDELLVRGHHNVDNAMVATAISLCLGVPAEVIGRALKTFRAIEHRMEEVHTQDGRLWVNDSKATNPDSTVRALTAYDQPIVLLGGRNKGSDLSTLVEVVAARAKGAVLFGEAGAEFEEAFQMAGHSAPRVDTLRDAVHLARRLSSAGDVILLSPACASFDEFTSYEDRGQRFKEWVREGDATA
jgi:UDP-N-acetylmuramoylalanine--D-glutamate ligase